jgi:hypothetical protein
MNIETYFSEHWKQDWSQFSLTGYNILSQLPVQGKGTILDVGCGFNPLKRWFEDRLWGIDPYNICADELVSIENYVGPQYDIALALGSINFGTFTEVFNQTRKMVSHVKPGGKIIWRQNPGVHDHPSPEFQNIKLFPWTFRLNIEIAEELNCEVVDLRWDNNRIYSEWKCIGS